MRRIFDLIGYYTIGAFLRSMIEQPARDRDERNPANTCGREGA